MVRTCCSFLAKYQFCLKTNHGENPSGWRMSSTTFILWGSLHSLLSNQTGILPETSSMRTLCGTGNEELRLTNGISASDGKAETILLFTCSRNVSFCSTFDLRGYLAAEKKFILQKQTGVSAEIALFVRTDLCQKATF